MLTIKPESLCVWEWVVGGVSRKCWVGANERKWSLATSAMTLTRNDFLWNIYIYILYIWGFPRHNLENLCTSEPFSMIFHFFFVILGFFLFILFLQRHKVFYLYFPSFLDAGKVLLLPAKSFNHQFILFGVSVCVYECGVSYIYLYIYFSSSPK